MKDRSRHEQRPRAREVILSMVVPAAVLAAVIVIGQDRVAAAQGQQVQLQASRPAAQKQAENFEVVSVRPSVAGGGGERGAGGGVRRRNPRPAGEPCGSQREPLLDPRRFDASETTLHALITWAYGVN